MSAPQSTGPHSAGRHSALDIAAGVATGAIKAAAVVQSALDAMAGPSTALNAFTTVLDERARRKAARVDADVATSRDAGALAGVPFGAKENFDVAGLTTLAGSVVEKGRPVARRDAAAVRRLEQAGAVLVGTTNMDEYAYGFTTENSHRGPCRNPHDPSRVAGGSSGGSAAAVAAGLVPLALGTDTNGSVRVPSALCGIFGLKPTFGHISRAGTLPFVPSLDTVGIFARTVSDLAVAFAILAGPDPDDPVCSPRPPATLPEGLVGRGRLRVQSDLRCTDMGQADMGQAVDGLRVAVAGGYFERGGTSPCLRAVTRAAAALETTARVQLPGAAMARAAAFVVTAAEGAQLRLEDLRERAKDFDPMTRYRFIAGALMPADAYIAAQRARRAWCEKVHAVLAHADVVLAPATPFPAPLIGQREIGLDDGRTVLTQPYLGVYTQPVSFAGLPVVAVPAGTHDGLPVGVQVIGRPFAEGTALAVAAYLEQCGFSALAPPEVFISRSQC